MTMKKEITEFYSEQGKPISKMVAVGVARLGLTGEAIKEAAKILYDEIQDGLEVKPIRLAWEVFDRAKKVHLTNVHDQDHKEAELRKQIAELQKAKGDLFLKLIASQSEYQHLESIVHNFREYCSLPWYKRLRRMNLE